MLVNRSINSESSKTQNKRGGEISLLWFIEKFRANTSENWKQSHRESVCKSQQEAVFLTKFSMVLDLFS